MNKQSIRIIDLTVEELKEIPGETINNLKLNGEPDKFISTKITLTQLCGTYGCAKPPRLTPIIHLPFLLFIP